MMEKIYFFENDETFLISLKEQLREEFAGAKKVAIKLHMGEPGNKYALKPDFVKKVVTVLKELNFEPFLFDSPVVYNSQRNTPEGYVRAAEKHGFTKEKVGCDVIISNESVEVKGKKLTYGVCNNLIEADAVLVLTHLKGHICSGFGGAIKNLGMGALSKETKGLIHGGGKPVYEAGCIFCGKCAEACPTDNIRYDDSGPCFDKSWCCGCSDCAIVCPEKVIKTKVDTFDFLLSEGASSAVKNFKKAYYVNVMRNITRLCDCVSSSGPIIFDDVGILMGKNAATVDKASFDVITEKAKKDIFKEAHNKSPTVHIKEASSLGLGELEYELAS